MTKPFFRHAFCLIFFVGGFSLYGQEEEDKGFLKVEGAAQSRYMRTQNRGDLADFSIWVTHTRFNADYKINKWLSAGFQYNFLVHSGTDGIDPDPITGSGPIYEGNLWNRRLMTGSSELSLPQIFIQASFDKHTITVGDFIWNTPAINGEPWPFPNALEGVRWQYESDKLRLQLAGVTAISSRFSGEFENVGDAIGIAGVGRDVFGNPSGYRGNTESDFIVVANASFPLGEKLSMDIWNYYVDNVTTTLLLEPTFKLEDKGYTFKAMYIYQSKVGRGGNDLQNLAYQFDGQSSYLGLRVEKDWNNNQLQFNFSRIGSEGRLLLPREWGKEPFYTFQRRTRIEGLANVTALMLRYQKKWEQPKNNFRLYSSLGQQWTPDVTNPAENKLNLPSHLHWDVSGRYELNGYLKGLALEVLAAYRWLVEDIGNDQLALINRANFFHLDVMLSYGF